MHTVCCSLCKGTIESLFETADCRIVFLPKTRQQVTIHHKTALCSLFFVEHFLTDFLKCHAAYWNFFPLFVSLPPSHFSDVTQRYPPAPLPNALRDDSTNRSHMHCSTSLPGKGDYHIKVTGMLVGKFKLTPEGDKCG